MIVDNRRKIHFLTNQQIELIRAYFKRKKDIRYLSLFSLMLETGLRVSEATNLRLKDFSFQDRKLIVKTLKRKNHFREIPLSEQILDDLSDYLNTFQNLGDANQLLFPSKTDKNKPIARQLVNRKFLSIQKNIPQIPRLTPHMLRHTFATRLVAKEVPLIEVKTALGHSSVQNTEIYSHVTFDKLKSSLDHKKKTSALQKLWQKIFKKKRIVLPEFYAKKNDNYIGRHAQMRELTENCNKHINTIVLGDKGVGKSALLERLQFPKSLRVDDLTNIKNVLKGILLFLLEGDKAKFQKMLMPNVRKIDSYLTRQSVKNLSRMCKTICEKYEYIIIVDDATNLTQSGAKFIENMNDHFGFVISARVISIDKAAVLSNFQKITLENLARTDALLLVDSISASLIDKIEDYDFYRNHIYEQTSGNPQYIVEIVYRYSREIYISNDIVASVRHTTALREIDMSLIVILALMLLGAMRYWGRATGEVGFQLLGGIALILLLGFRFFMRLGRRKNL